MITQKDILNCLPLLASVLGDQYGVQVCIGGSEACTDGKIINLLCRKFIAILPASQIGNFMSKNLAKHIGMHIFEFEKIRKSVPERMETFSF